MNEDGLEPLAYLPAGLTSFSNVTEQLGTDPQDLAKFDIAMTAVTLKLAREISGGQFEPNSLSRYNDITPERVDAGQALKVLAWTPFPDAYLKGLMPNHESYGLMKAELAKLRASKLKPAFEKIAEGTPVKVGKSDPRIALVRDRMADMGFLGSKESHVEADFENTLDTDLSAALKKFQKSVKLRQTGILDAATVKNLNRDTSQKDIQRLVYNMERLRWLPERPSPNMLLVNIPEFRLHVVEADTEVWAMDVVVGAQATSTLIFSDLIFL